MISKSQRFFSALLIQISAGVKWVYDRIKRKGLKNERNNQNLD
jgi:hypothetical protein